MDTNASTMPDYYRSSIRYDCISVAERYDFHIGNAIACAWRHPYRNRPLDDLREALWHIDREIERTGSTTFTSPDGTDPTIFDLSYWDVSYLRDFWDALDHGDLAGMKQVLEALIPLFENEQQRRGGQDIQVWESLNPYSQKTSTQRRKG